MGYPSAKTEQGSPVRVREVRSPCLSLKNAGNEEEFKEMLDFILNQWRNVHQRKVAPTAIDDEADVK
ncbi:hypothetical protein L916_08779 [Phytophthora nicotianae]|uniref:Uncharacterized protein n=1 Tax=Phytophthora nicotianae TaxID=4792 RepID=W2J2T2_PHYNI|nr:hypothetical protein L916_08779 [Phytophthora nicotianae]